MDTLCQGGYFYRDFYMADTIHLRGFEKEDFVNYKKPSMFLGTCFCDLKCCKERKYDFSICQNSEILKQEMNPFKISSIYNIYKKSDIVKAVVIGGLEPLLQIDEITSLINYFRKHGCDDDIVVYTGYTEQEVMDNSEWKRLLEYHNIVMKYGRFIQGDKPHFDEVLGINLISDNQYAKRY